MDIEETYEKQNKKEENPTAEKQDSFNCISWIESHKTGSIVTFLIFFILTDVLIMVANIIGWSISSNYKNDPMLSDCQNWVIDGLGDLSFLYITIPFCISNIIVFVGFWSKQIGYDGEEECCGSNSSACDQLVDIFWMVLFLVWMGYAFMPWSIWFVIYNEYVWNGINNAKCSEIRPHCIAMFILLVPLVVLRLFFILFIWCKWGLFDRDSKTDETKEDSDIELGASREYIGIIKALRECFENDWVEYLNEFKKQKVSDDIVLDLTDEQLSKLIPLIGMRVKFKKCFKGT
eukprot:95098_1